MSLKTKTQLYCKLTLSCLKSNILQTKYDDANEPL